MQYFKRHEVAPEEVFCRQRRLARLSMFAINQLGGLINYVLIRHEVADFPSWKEAYDSHAASRSAAGLKEERLLHNAEKKNEVILLFSASDLKKAKEFAGSSDLRQKMQAAGVSDIPDIYFLTD